MTDWEKILKTNDQNNFSKEYINELEGFVQYANQVNKSVEFSLQRSTLPNRYVLLFNPKLIQDAITTMLSIILRNDKYFIIPPDYEGSNDNIDVNDIDKLKRAIANIYNNPWMQTQIKLMTELNDKKVFDGYIHTGDIYNIQNRDIKVAISKEDMEKFYATPSGSIFNLEAKQLINTYPQTSKYNPETNDIYHNIECSGFIGRIEKIDFSSADSDRLKLDVKKI